MQYLPRRFVARVFGNATPPTILLTDAMGFDFPCRIKWKDRGHLPPAAFLRGGWKRFVTENRLAVGKSVRLSVNLDNPYVMYAREARMEI
jgi:hypothetical protein